MVFDFLCVVLSAVLIWISFGVLAYIVSKCCERCLIMYRNVRLRLTELDIILLFGPVIFCIVCEDIYRAYQNHRMWQEMLENLPPIENYKSVNWEKNGF